MRLVCRPCDVTLFGNTAMRAKKAGLKCIFCRQPYVEALEN